MAAAKADDFVGRHLIVDASTYTRRNLTSTDTVFALLEGLARNLDMTLLLPPIVCRYPFANDELATFCDDIEVELAQRSRTWPRMARSPSTSAWPRCGSCASSCGGASCRRAA